MNRTWMHRFKKLGIAGLSLVVLTTFSYSKDSRAENYICDSMSMGGAAGAFLTTTTAGPIGTLLVLSCWQDADIDAVMVEREATMLLEENRIYQPSYLAGYAESIGSSDLRETAKDVVAHGVRQ